MKKYDSYKQYIDDFRNQNSENEKMFAEFSELTDFIVVISENSLDAQTEYRTGGLAWLRKKIDSITKFNQTKEHLQRYIDIAKKFLEKHIKHRLTQLKDEKKRIQIHYFKQDELNKIYEKMIERFSSIPDKKTNRLVKFESQFLRKETDEQHEPPKGKFTSVSEWNNLSQKTGCLIRMKGSLKNPKFYIVRGYTSDNYEIIYGIDTGIAMKTLSEKYPQLLNQ